MRTVTLTVESAGCDADAAFARISKFDTFPELIDDVRSITVREADGGTITSDWEVYFRNGPLRWSEVDYFQPEQRRITFEQIEGDFEAFRGRWQVTEQGIGCRIEFEVAFDFGIPSLEGVLEPIATKVLKEGMAYALLQLLGDAEVVGDPVVAAALTAKLAAAAPAA
ncbi:type II toxin-antitoxin system RatA family toxin [Nocardia sp. NPDC051570]|uniref:type II toxin-antitoxin system RatA family toxin n=1 Tax=Nocardia sp. NPDC051570 TaxID=3364324 RepID=UPI0037AF0070